MSAPGDIRAQIVREDFGAGASAVEALLRDYSPHVGQPNAALANFYSNVETPRQACIDWLIKRQGVPVLALACDGDGAGVALGEAFVEIDDCGRFEFSDLPHGEEAMRALIIVARDDSGVPLDLIAWAPKTDQVASYNGICSVLGAHLLADLELDEVVQVHRDMIEWLKAGRNGIVIIDHARAWRVVEGDVLGAVDVDHGLELRRVLQPPAPRIVISNAREAA